MRSNLVRLPTRVQRKNGETIYGLKQEQFIVEDNGSTAASRSGGGPGDNGLSLVVAVRWSRFAEAELEKFKWLATMIEGIVGEAPHEVAIVSYGEGPYLLGDFSSHDEDARFALSRLQRCGDFHAVTIDTVNYAIHLLKRRQNRYRRAIVLISETRDLGSHSKLHEVIAELGVSDIVIYSVAFSPARDELLDLLRNGMEGRQLAPPAPSPIPTGRPRASPTPTPPPAPAPTPTTPEPIYLDHAPRFPSPPPEILHIVNALRHSTASELASLSGGEYINFTTPKSFEKALQRIANQVRFDASGFAVVVMILGDPFANRKPKLRLIVGRRSVKCGLCCCDRRVAWVSAALTRDSPKRLKTNWRKRVRVELTRASEANSRRF